MNEVAVHFAANQVDAEVAASALRAARLRPRVARDDAMLGVAGGLSVGRFVVLVPEDQVARAREALKPWVALYVGGMGSKTKNFYNDLVSKYGFAEDARTLQELFLGGKQLEAIRQVPDALVDAISVAGPASYVRERLEVWASAGVTTLLASVHGKTQANRLRTLEMLAAAASTLD